MGAGEAVSNKAKIKYSARSFISPSLSIDEGWIQISHRFVGNCVDGSGCRHPSSALDVAQGEIVAVCSTGLEIAIAAVRAKGVLKRINFCY